MMGADLRDSRRAWIALAGWVVVAAVVGALEPLRRLPGPMVQVVIVSLTVLFLLVTWRVGWARRWVAGVDLRALVAVHLTRLVGLYFLWLHARGRLPWAFAVPAGYGDVIVAVLAAPLVVWRAPRAVMLAWNVLGLIDIVLVVAVAARLGMADPGSMRELARWPLDLLPLLIVPLIIGTHVVMLARKGART
jgi:hypothetical protein